MSIAITAPQKFDFQDLVCIELMLRFEDTAGAILFVEREDGEDAEIVLPSAGTAPLIIEVQVQGASGPVTMADIAVCQAHCPAHQARPSAPLRKSTGLVANSDQEQDSRMLNASETFSSQNVIIIFKRTNQEAAMTKTNWDYSSHASSYDARADYSAKLIDRLLHQAGCAPSQPVADIGAGTGKLTKELVARKLAVCAIEPNDKMRKFGAKNVPSVKWIDGTAENTGLHDNSVTGAFFGSSFNVADQKETVKEAYRILSPNGIIACMWNHRDLDDPQQRAIEGVIKLNIPSYDYGTRRADPSEALVDGGFFHRVTALEDRFIAKLDAKAWVYGWRSHATLARQGNRALIESILDDISRVVGDREVIEVPYYTRCWWAISTNDAARKNSA